MTPPGPSDRMPSGAYSCRLCSTSVSSSFTARETMHGAREIFAYIECPNCGCVQIAEIPGDLARFYPQDYYSFQLRAHRLRQSRAAAERRPAPPLSTLVAFFLYEEATRRNRDAAILDVGSGAGELVEGLQGVWSLPNGATAPVFSPTLPAVDPINGDPIYAVSA